MNYGETLASWYLRLNGFFPLPDFVLHRFQEDDDGNIINADIDLLALRMPHVFEEIGGQQSDWDLSKLSRFINVRIPVGLIVEVKTSQRARPRQSIPRLERGVQRLGLLPREWAADVVEELTSSSDSVGFFTSETAIIGTVLICDDSRVDYYSNQYSCVIGLRDCERFIIHRFSSYSDEKRGARLFFPNDLIQFLASKAGVN